MNSIIENAEPKHEELDWNW